MRKEIVGNAATTEITAGIDDNDLAITLDEPANYPDGAVGSFVLCLDNGTASEEKILCSARSGANVTISERGYDDTTPVAHASGASVQHVLDANTLDEANRHVNLQTTKGDLIIHNGTVPVRKGSGAVDNTTDGHVAQLKWSEATGWSIEKLVTVARTGSAPSPTGYVQIWVDTTNNVLRTTDGDSWPIVGVIPSVASAAARDTLFSEAVNGNACWRTDGQVLQVRSGGAWKTAGLAKVADATARDAFYPAPADGDQAYLTGSHVLQLYRSDEWVTLSNKVTVADTQPLTNRQVGDTWYQPID